MSIGGIPRDLTLALRSASGIDTLVETGTYKGDTTTWAAKYFAQVITLEGHKPRYTATKKTLKDLQNVTMVYADSRTLAKHLPDGPVILWLDAHWCGNYELSASTPGECPLMDELKAVRPDDIILIDDARLFLSPPPKPHDFRQWPNMVQIRHALPGRYVTVIGDVIVAVPQQYAAIVRKHTGDTTALQVTCLTSNDYVGMIPGFAHFYLRTIGESVPCMIVRYDARPAKQALQTFRQFAIGPQTDFTWSSGIMRYLEHYGHDLILLMLEDYWIESADTRAMRTAWAWMQAHPEVDKLDLSGDRLKVAHTVTADEIAPGYATIQSAPDAPFLTSLQAAIWRTDFLRKALHPTENAWQFEKKGTKRVSGKCTVLGTNPPMMTYVNACGGEGKKPGQIDARKVPHWMISELNSRGIF